jgi:hypothetical protein
MTVIARVQAWWLGREIRRLVDASGDCMLMLARQQFREALTDEEQAELMGRYNAWLCADRARLLGLVDEPVRTIHLFLSEAIQ